MKELIDKLARGTIEYDLPVLEASVSEINRTLNSEKVYEDGFSVFSSNDIELKGFVYSTNENIVIIDKCFSGVKQSIRYSIDTKYINEGDIIEGQIYVVSNGGELIIPVSFKVDSPSFTTSIGELKNLFHFANLVQMNYDEALSIFKSPDFVHIFLQEDFYLLSMYEGLKKSTSPEMAMEEFLVSANKKRPTRISLSAREKNYGNITENEGDTIVISKDSWGYTDIDVIVKDDFLKVSKTKITSNDFAGSNYELSYLIEVDKLHAGTNYGMIEFVTKAQRERFVVAVNCDVRKSDERKAYKESVRDILKKYIDFRVHRISMDKWADDTLDIIERMRGISDNSVYMKLLQAQICISKGMESDASWLLESAAEELFENGNKDTELYCYYLYVRTIQKRNTEFTEEMIEKIRKIYNTENNNWKILWILFYLDESYDNNLSIKLARIKEQFVMGMKSPLMYYEAMSAFAEYPEFLRVLDDFELQALNFGSREGMISKQLAGQVAEIAMTAKSFNKLLFSILAELYDIYGTKTILTAIVGMLIKGNKTDSKYFLWYEEAVNEEIKLTSLFEYFMYSIPEDYNRPLPQNVIMYFGYNSGISSKKLAMVYENIIKHKVELENVYRMYQSQMEKFVAKCIDEELIDEHLAVVYADVLKKVMVTPETAVKLPKLMNTYLITCQQDNIGEVEIIHKETEEVYRYPVVDGKAYVQIYTEDAAIVFIDLNGIRYGKSVVYTSEKLLDMEEYLDLCFEISTENDWLILYSADRYLKYRKNPVKSIGVLKYLTSMENVRTEYKVYVEKEIIEYYSNNYDLEAVDEHLMTVDGMDLGTKSRIKLIELMIVRGMYERAYDFMKIYGYSVIDPGKLLRCGSKLIEKREYEKDEFLTDIVIHAYRHGKYNEKVLRYLSLHYEGSAKETYELWNSCKLYDYSDRNLEENLIACILFTGAQAAHIGEIYETYQRKGAREKVRRAFLFAKAYDYFVKEKIVDESIFKYIEKDIVLDNPIHDICRLAYAKYCSQKKQLEQKQCEICRDIIFDMCKKGRIFEFYKNFQKYFALPVAVQDKTIVEYHTNPRNRVLIHYILVTGSLKEQNYTITEMTDTCNGVFIKDFILFYGEEIQYYITEEYAGEQSITESNSLTVSDSGMSDLQVRESRYTMLNDIMISNEMHEEKTLSEMAAEYMIMSQLGDAIFTIK